MKVCLLSMMIIFSLLFDAGCSSPGETEDGTSSMIRFCYYRPDASYTGWELHLWNNQGWGPTTWSSGINLTADGITTGNPNFPYHVGTTNCGGYTFQYVEWKYDPVVAGNGINYIVHNGNTKDVVYDMMWPDPVQNRTVYYFSGNPASYTFNTNDEFYIPASRYTKITGSIPVLVILAEFSDQAHVGPETTSHWIDKIFNATTSLNAIYSNNSTNAVKLVKAQESHGSANDGIIGWINIGVNHPNTGADMTYQDYLLIGDASVAAVQAADPFIDYSQYDSNGNGVIDRGELSIVIISAGYDSSWTGVDSRTPCHLGSAWIYPSLPQKAVCDGVTITSAVMMGEVTQRLSDPSYLYTTTTGLIAHEMAHTLGLPDLYYGSRYMIGKWGMMANGAMGNTPVQFSPWSKIILGWTEPTIIQNSTNGVSLPKTTYSLNPNVFYKINASLHEYFLIQCVRKDGYNTLLPGEGLLIWHIHVPTTETGHWINQDVDKPGVRLIQADGNRDLENGINSGDSTDPFYAGNVDHYTATNYDGTAVFSITNISSVQDTMTFDIIMH